LVFGLLSLHDYVAQRQYYHIRQGLTMSGQDLTMRGDSIYVVSGLAICCQACQKEKYQFSFWIFKISGHVHNERSPLTLLSTARKDEDNMERDSACSHLPRVY
jgi:hypothetical protein